MEHKQTFHTIEAHYNSEDLKDILYNGWDDTVTDKTKFIIVMVGACQNVFAQVVNRTQLEIHDTYIHIKTPNSLASKPIEKVLYIKQLKDCKPF